MHSLLTFIQAFNMRTYILAILILISFTACGGGGGGGGTSAALQFTSSGSGSAASASFAAGNSTTDMFNNRNGSSITYSYGPNGLTFSASKPGLYGEAINNMTISSGSRSTDTVGWDSTNYSYDYTSGTRNGIITVAIPTNYTELFGLAWAIDSPTVDYYVVTTMAVGNYGSTPYASLPSSGSATYTGEMSGIYIKSYFSGGTDSVNNLTGAVSIAANWASKTVNVSATPIIGSTTYGTLTGSNGSIDSNSSFSLNIGGGGFTGSMRGIFAGSNYTEVGGVLVITEGGSSYNGGNASFMAKR
tara:strand:- start:1385 stop:2290 length:906 start_codon:yes stop_codon:yes gene_type:complete